MRESNFSTPYPILTFLAGLVAWLGIASFLACHPAAGQSAAPPRASSTDEATPASPAKTPKPGKPERPDPSREFFEKGATPRIKLELLPEAMQSLRQEPRRYVEANLIEDGKTTYKGVSVKLKGAAGSFRNLDDRPALTLNMKRGKEGELFHGLDKFHLNNSVQDESYLSEWLCTEICREAGCPAARVTHARVWINNRDLGLYVLKEGFDKQFLKRSFADPSGNLYDGGFLLDIDQDLERDEGAGPLDRADLKALRNACRESDPARRWERIAQRLDVPAFLNFVALEFMMCHWDGYANNRNNYRVYFRPEDGRAVFLPHGMDQMFGDPNFPCFHHPGPLVVNAVFHNPAWRAEYRERVKALLPAFAPDKLNAKLDLVAARLRPVLAEMGAGRARQFDARVREFKDRVATRAQNIRNQLPSPPPEPLVFGEEGWVTIEDWNPAPLGDARLDELEVEGKACYLLETGPSRLCMASWRKKVLLTKGSYRLEAIGRVADVVPLPGEKGRGLGLRISGGTRENHLTGNSKWERLSHSFEILEDSREVELVAELRSVAGRAWLEAESLRLVKVAPPSR